MTKYYAFVIIMALRLIYQPGTSSSNYNAFAIPPAKMTSFKGTVQQQKVYLQWEVEDNQTADRFTIEKSEDGKNFRVAALAFGSDQPGIFQYQFYEKAGNQKSFYRIHLVNKDQQTEYSEVIALDPANFHS